MLDKLQRERCDIRDIMAACGDVTHPTKRKGEQASSIKASGFLMRATSQMVAGVSCGCHACACECLACVSIYLVCDISFPISPCLSVCLPACLFAREMTKDTFRTVPHIPREHLASLAGSELAQKSLSSSHDGRYLGTQSCDTARSLLLKGHRTDRPPQHRATHHPP